MSLICIWAESQNRIIGKDGRLPWRISEETCSNLRRKTLGHTLIFGYNTYQGFEGRKLPGRKMELYDPSLKDSIYEDLEMKTSLSPEERKLTKNF